jgi:uncharacterized protein DUF664
VPGMDLNTMTTLPAAGDEIQTLLGVLDRNRRTFAWKCFGLDAAGMNTRLAPSTMTLGGLVKHLALVEDDMFSHRLFGRDPGAPWNTVDWDADPDWEWRTAADDSPEELQALWEGTRRWPRRWPRAGWTRSARPTTGRTCAGWWRT